MCSFDHWRSLTIVMIMAIQHVFKVKKLKNSLTFSYTFWDLLTLFVLRVLFLLFFLFGQLFCLLWFVCHLFCLENVIRFYCLSHQVKADVSVDQQENRSFLLLPTKLNINARENVMQNCLDIQWVYFYC